MRFDRYSGRGGARIFPNGENYGSFWCSSHCPWRGELCSHRPQISHLAHSRRLRNTAGLPSAAWPKPREPAPHAVHAHSGYGGPARLPGHRSGMVLRWCNSSKASCSPIRQPLKKKQRCPSLCSSMYYSVCVHLLPRAARESRGFLPREYAIQRRSRDVPPCRTVHPGARRRCRRGA
jgi:hypothetical protein